MEKAIMEQVGKALNECMVKELVGYNKPLSKLTERVISENETKLFKLISEEFDQLLDSTIFKKSLKQALNDKLAKVLVSRMGGELEKQVNALKADPRTRAKITMAIDAMLTESK